MTENTLKVTPTANEKPLESWKEIATYLKRDVRTVRRWEKSEGLPVLRHMHLSRASVYAYPTELDAWLATREPESLREDVAPIPRWRALTALAAVLLLTLVSVGSGPLPTRANAADGAEVVARRILDRVPYGSVSPDGRFLTEVDWSTGDLALFDLASLKLRRLTNKGSWVQSSEYAELSVVSPDSKQIAYAWFNGRSYDLRLISTDGSGLRVLYSHPDVEYVLPGAWSPDGRYLTATLAKRDKANQIALVSVADGATRVLKTFDWRFPAVGPFSPDGRRIVYSFPPKEDSPAYDIYLLAIDGSEEITLVAHPANDGHLGWSPDGREFLFQSNRTGTRGIWAVAMHEGKPTGDPRLVKPNFGQMQILGLTREGSLFYGVSTSLRDAFIAPLDLTTGTGLGTPKPVQEARVGATLWPRWSKDGKTLVYVRVERPDSLRRVAIVIRSLATGAERELKPDLNFDNRNNIHPSLSLDGRSLLVAAMDRRGRQGIFQVDAQTGDFTLVVRAEPGTTFSFPTWSPNGETIFYRTENPDRSTLVAREAATGHERKLYEAAGGQIVRNMNVSRDGQHIAFVQIESATRSSALKVVSIAGGTPRELFRVQEPESMAGIAAPGWTPDGQYVIVRKFRQAQPAPEITLWAIPVAGGKPKPLGSAPSGHMLLLDVHPDGQRIAFTAGESKGELWVMENFLPQVRAAK